MELDLGMACTVIVPGHILSRLYHRDTFHVSDTTPQ
jgi:hypothetical protein